MIPRVYFYCMPLFILAVSAVDISGFADLGLQSPPKLQEYRRVANSLVQSNHYSGLLEAIADCAKNPGYFIVLDCPSGSGKTLAGVALRELDCKFTDIQKCHLSNLRIIHVVWDDAVRMQEIYSQILRHQAAQRIRAEMFFIEAKKFLLSHASEISTMQAAGTKNELCAFVWEHFLQPLFTKENAKVFNLDEFQDKYDLRNKLLIIFSDETPAKVEDVFMIGRLRDILKTIPGVVLILAGTHAKAMNMIGLTKGSVSSSDSDNLDPWAIIVTRLPRFSLAFSGLERSWRAIKRNIFKTYTDPSIQKAISAVQSSIDKGGNPRLIVIAVRALANAPVGVSFHSWQTNYADTLARTKFCLRGSWSGGLALLAGQLNLLMEASANADLADVMINAHLAQRVIPDQGSFHGTGPGSKLSDCGGWLYVSSDKERVFKNSLFFLPGRLAIPSELYNVKKLHLWQATIFPKVNSDILVYLASCRQGGYFSVLNAKDSIEYQFNACEVMKRLWCSNSAGMVSFQNPSAIINSGSFLEVLLAAAVFNAATTFPGSSGSLPKFFIAFLKQLGIVVTDYCADTISKSFCDDPSLNEVMVPRCLFPGEQLPGDFTGLIGLVQRKRNMDKYDLEVKHLFRADGEPLTINFLRLKAKSVLNTGNAKVAKVARKIVRQHGELGVLVLLNCCDYWNTHTNTLELSLLLKDASAAPCHVGKIYFVSDKGDLSFLIIGDQPGRLLLVKIPKESGMLE